MVIQDHHAELSRVFHLFDQKQGIEALGQKPIGQANQGIFQEVVPEIHQERSALQIRRRCLDGMSQAQRLRLHNVSELEMPWVGF